MIQKQLTKDDLRHIKIVDSAEPGEIRARLLELGWRQSRLLSGDYTFYTCQYDKVVITRKTVSDCLASLNEHFGKQLEEMLESYQICVMLIEGAWHWSVDTGQLLTSRGLERHVKKEVLNYIHRWEAKGFILERTANWHDTVDRLNELYALYQKPYSLSARSKGYADERLLALPSGLRGKAGQCLLQGHSLQDIANMTAEQILSLKLEGIGKKRSELCYNHFNRRDSNADDTRDNIKSEEPTLLL